MGRKRGAEEADDVSMQQTAAASGSDGDDIQDDDDDVQPLPKMVKPIFAPITPAELADGKSQARKVPVPAHRYTQLRESWTKLYTPIVEHLQLQIRMNTKSRSVELRTSEHTTDIGALQKATDFVKAFILGFAIEDAIALVRVDDLFVESFEIKDVKRLAGDSLSRAIGRIAGKDGKTKFTIENTTRTRIVLADTHIHILGSFNNIKVARDAICDLIMGSPPGKIFARLRSLSTRIAERF
eukprot:TRINITY_DN15_c0_g1_i1.p2 TRINITY_DN15_c0_g1~~TRINITY_DN15_c0_g1_i1.p2  ORF type:complete len:253 (+),score=34.28 TRINITY_DN15_c0_g1_i1:41-760(+)